MLLKNDFVFETGPPKQTLNLGSSCLGLISDEITGMHYHFWQVFKFSSGNEEQGKKKKRWQQEQADP